MRFDGIFFMNRIFVKEAFNGYIATITCRFRRNYVSDANNLLRLVGEKDVKMTLNYWRSREDAAPRGYETNRDCSTNVGLFISL